jgi:hypothetical protein
MPSVIRSLAAAAVLALAPMAAFAGPAVNTNDQNIAIEGYDPVAYHTEGRPMPGDPAISHDWHEATWLFASTEHKALFVANPDRYAPQFGGFCSGAMSLGKVASIDPNEWVIVDGQLFLGGRPGAVEYLFEGGEDRLADAAANWQAVRQSD